MQLSSVKLRSAGDVRSAQLQDRDVRARWEAQAPARAVALRLVQYRAEHGLTQTELARRLGLKQPAVARMETGEHAPTIRTLLRIAEALEIEILLDIKPSSKEHSWVSSRADQAQVIERVTTSKGGEMVVFTS